MHTLHNIRTNHTVALAFTLVTEGHPEACFKAIRQQWEVCMEEGHHTNWREEEGAAETPAESIIQSKEHTVTPSGEMSAAKLYLSASLIEEASDPGQNWNG